MKRRLFKIGSLLLLSTLVAAIICEYKGDTWEEIVRTALYRASNDSVPAYSKEIIDEKSIPYVDYFELNGIKAGKQYNPTIICNYAINYYQQIDSDTSAKRKFFNCVQRLENDLTYKDGYALYLFNWKQPWYDSVGIPFTSGMTSGLAIQVFTYAYRLSSDVKYLNYCKVLLKGYFVPIRSGGFTYMNDDGWWYEEVADTAMHTPKILDGHIFALTGVNEYWQIAKDDSAKLIFTYGIKALKAALPFYDVGNGWAYYDKYRKPTDKKYQRILTSQMKQLYNITHDEVFKKYYSAWRKPLNRPYLLRVISERNRSGLILVSILTCFIYSILFLLYSWVCRLWR